MDSAFAPVVGIFDGTEQAYFTKYRVTARFTQWVVGGIPQKPEIIESWLRERILGGDEELRIMLLKTLDDLGIEVSAEATREEIIAAASKIAAARNGNTFRRCDAGLCLAGYNPKAMCKEATSILFPYYDDEGITGQKGHRWGPTKKAAKAYLSEVVYVDEYQIPLGRQEPDGVHTHIGHPRGKATLTYVDYCVQPEIAFTVSSLQDRISRQQWEAVLILGQRLGMGALRSMGYGQFKIIGFDRQ